MKCKFHQYVFIEKTLCNIGFSKTNYMKNEENMDKVVLNRPILEDAVVHYGDVKIYVKRMLSIKEQAIIIKEYINSLFSSDETTGDALIADYAMKVAILDIATNIDISNLDVDYMAASDLYREITSYIMNYELLLKNIEKSVELHYRRNSLDVVIKNAVDSFGSLMNKITDTNIDDNFIKSIAESAKEIKALSETKAEDKKPVVSKKGVKKATK